MPTRLLTAPAPDLLAHLRDLYVERALAELEGLASHTAYAADLEAEIVACRAAYIGAAVIEIATLRAQLSAPLVG